MMSPASFFDRQAHHTDRTQNRLRQFLYDPPAFVVRHAIMAALRSMSEARMNGAPGKSRELLRVEC